MSYSRRLENVLEQIETVENNLNKNKNNNDNINYYYHWIEKLLLQTPPKQNVLKNFYIKLYLLLNPL